MGNKIQVNSQAVLSLKKTILCFPLGKNKDQVLGLEPQALCGLGGCGHPSGLI